MRGPATSVPKQVTPTWVLVTWMQKEKVYLVAAKLLETSSVPLVNHGLIQFLGADQVQEQVGPPSLEVFGQ